MTVNDVVLSFLNLRGFIKPICVDTYVVIRPTGVPGSVHSQGLGERVTVGQNGSAPTCTP